MDLIKKITLIIFLNLLLINNVFADEFPKATGHVNDFAQVLSEDHKKELENSLRTIRDEKGVQIAVVTVKTAEPLDPTTYRVNLFKEWGVGEKGKDNGLLLILFKKERKVSMEVGYGLEAIIPDGISAQITRSMGIFFKKNQYGEGFLYGIKQIEEKIVEEKASPKTKKNTSDNYSTVLGLIFIPLIVLGFFILNDKFSKAICPRCKSRKHTKITNTQIVKKASYFSDGLKSINNFCSKCNYNWISSKKISSTSNDFIPPVGGGMGGGSSSGWGGSSSSNDSFGGFDGGSSGGGGSDSSY